MSWSSAQVRMLEAMGYEPMHRWSGSTAPAPAAAVASPRASAAPLRRVAPVADARGPAEPATAAVDLAALAAALQRAAGGRDVAALVGDIERLRRDPALKRALWPRLRALRRTQ